MEEYHRVIAGGQLLEVFEADAASAKEDFDAIKDDIVKMSRNKYLDLEKVAAGLGRYMYDAVGYLHDCRKEFDKLAG